MTESTQTAAYAPRHTNSSTFWLHMLGYCKGAKVETAEASGHQTKQARGNHENQVPSFDFASQIPLESVNRIRSQNLNAKSWSQVLYPSRWIPVALFFPEPNRTLCYLVFLQPPDQRNVLAKTAQTALPFLWQSRDLLYPLAPLAAS